MELLLSLMVLGGMSAAAMVVKSAVLYFVSAAVALSVGLAWYSTYTTTLGLSISLGLFCYMVYCIVMAYNVLWLRAKKGRP